MTETPEDLDVLVPTSARVENVQSQVQTDKPTTKEVGESLTGYEEIAIERAFGADATELKGNKPVRALAFVLKRRAGLSHDDALRTVMEMPIKQCVDLFEDAADDDDDDDGDPEFGTETPAGKDAASRESGRRT